MDKHWVMVAWHDAAAAHGGVLRVRELVGRITLVGLLLTVPRALMCTVFLPLFATMLAMTCQIDVQSTTKISVTFEQHMCMRYVCEICTSHHIQAGYIQLIMCRPTLSETCQPPPCRPPLAGTIVSHNWLEPVGHHWLTPHVGHHWPEPASH